MADDAEGGFGARVREAREARQLTRPQLAPMVGVDRHTIYQWERGAQTPRDLETIDRLAKALAVSGAWLVYGVDSHVERPVNPIWQGLIDDGTVKKYRKAGVPEERLRWVGEMPGARGGLRRQDFIERLNDELGRALAPEPGPEPEPARRAREAVEARGGPSDELPDPDTPSKR